MRGRWGCVAAGGPGRGVDRQVVNPARVTPGQEERRAGGDLLRGRETGGRSCPDFSRVSVYSRCDLGRQHGTAGLTCSMGSQVRCATSTLWTREGWRGGEAPARAWHHGGSHLRSAPRTLLVMWLRVSHRARVRSASPSEEESYLRAAVHVCLPAAERPGSSLHKTSFSPSWRHPFLFSVS